MWRSLREFFVIGFLFILQVTTKTTIIFSAIAVATAIATTNWFVFAFHNILSPVIGQECGI